MKALRQTLSWLIPVAIGLIIALLVKQFAFQLVKVDGPSMQPNLQNNERVVAVKTSKIHRGSVIVFDANRVDPQVSQTTDYVKRVIALPGDTVEAKNGYIYVNGKKTNQSYISKYQRTTGTGNWTLASISEENNWMKNMGATKVPKGMYFVLGTTVRSLTTVVTGALCRRIRLSGSSRWAFGPRAPSSISTTLTSSGSITLWGIS